MITIEFEDGDMENLINHKYTGIYKKFKSNAKLIADLDKVIRYIGSADTIDELQNIGSLNYESLVNSPYSSVRVGYKSKYRLIFLEAENRIKIKLLELSEHYGNH